MQSKPSKELLLRSQELGGGDSLIRKKNEFIFIAMVRFLKNAIVFWLLGFVLWFVFRVGFFRPLEVKKTVTLKNEPKKQTHIKL